MTEKYLFLQFCLIQFCYEHNNDVLKCIDHPIIMNDIMSSMNYKDYGCIFTPISLGCLEDLGLDICYNSTYVLQDTQKLTSTSLNKEIFKQQVSINDDDTLSEQSIVDEESQTDLEDKFPDIFSTICFDGKEKVLTSHGYIELSKINIDKHKINGNEIFSLTKVKYINKDVILMKKNSLGNNIPSKNTIITPDHCVFYKGNMLKAKILVNDKTIK